MEWVPVYVSDLEALKALLIIGFIASAVLLRMTWSIGAEPRVLPANYCKLHQRPEDQCVGMHDPDA